MKTAISAVAVGAIAWVAYLAASPYIAVYQIKTAVEQRDGTALAEFVDFPAVRQSIKDQFNAQAMKAVAGADSDAETGLAAVGAAIAGVMVEKMVDAAVTPAGLNTLFDNSKAKGVIGAPLQNATGSYEGVSLFVITSAHHDPAQQARFILRRQGLDTWKLTDVVLPPGILNQDDETDVADASDAAAAAADGPPEAAQGIGDLLAATDVPSTTPVKLEPAGTFQLLRNPGGVITAGRCHMGVCDWVKWLSTKTPVPRDVVMAIVQRGTSEHEEVDDYPSKPDGVAIEWAQPHTVAIACSHTEPTNSDSDGIITLSQKIGTFGYQESAALMYFMACHSDPSAQGLSASIDKYGYDVIAPQNR